MTSSQKYADFKIRVDYPQLRTSVTLLGYVIKMINNCNKSAVSLK